MTGKIIFFDPRDRYVCYLIFQGMKYLVPPPNKEHYPLDVDKGVGHNTISLGGPILIRYLFSSFVKVHLFMKNFS